MPSMPTPEPSDQTFRSALAILSHLLKEGDLLISLAPPFSISITIEQTVLAPHLEAEDISEADLRAVASDASDILRALLHESVDDYISSKIENLDEQAHPGTEAGLKARVDAVREGLYNDHLKGRYDLKRSSKAPAFNAIDWDIKTKIADGSIPDLVPFPYATCRLSYQRNFDESVWTVLGQPFDSVQVNFTVDEVRYVVRVLQAIEARLESAEPSKERERST